MSRRPGELRAAPQPGGFRPRLAAALTEWDDRAAVTEGSVTAILKTTDVAGTIEWYRRVGFEIRGVFPQTGDPTSCEVARDGLILQFLGGETPWPGPATFTGTFYLYPDSVDAVFEQIRDHTPPAWGPEVREWGTRELGLQDPNGYFLTFTEPA